MFIKTFLLLLLSSISAFAGGRGGHVTTFDPNLFGGGWACFRTLASGTCGGATAHYSNAACDGVTDDAAAMLDWLTYANALNPALVKLYIPPGCKLNLPGAITASCSFSANTFNRPIDTVVNNVIVWAYGVTTNCLWVGGDGYQNGQVGVAVSALVNTVAAGSTTVTLVTPAQNTIFSVGDWVAITGLSTQTFGSPPNNQFFEYKRITAINAGSGLITLSSPLTNSYESTWPQQDSGSVGSPNLGGPGTIYRMAPTWDINLTIYGLISNPSPPAQINVIGRNVIVHDTTFIGANGFAPSASDNIWLFGVHSGTTEIDKNVSMANFNNIAITSQILVQSSTGTYTLNGVSAAGLGTTSSTSVTNSKFNSITAGPTCCGAGNSLLLNGVTYTTPSIAYHYDNISNYSFSLNTFTMAYSTYVASSAASGLWVPGHKYYLGDTDGSNTCNPKSTFTVTSIIKTGANVNILTDLASVPATNICNSNVRPPSTIGSYRVMSLTSSFSGPGNLLNNPETLPP